MRHVEIISIEFSPYGYVRMAEYMIEGEDNVRIAGGKSELLVIAEIKSKVEQHEASLLRLEQFSQKVNAALNAPENQTTGQIVVNYVTDTK